MWNKIFHEYSLTLKDICSSLSTLKLNNSQLCSSGWLSKQMFSGIGFTIHVPVWPTPSLFNASCNWQKSDTTAARTPPQLSDLTFVLTSSATYYIFLKLRRKRRVECYMWSVYVALKLARENPKQRSSSSFSVTPQSSKINLLGLLAPHLAEVTPKQLAAAGVCSPYIYI